MIRRNRNDDAGNSSLYTSESRTNAAARPYSYIEEGPPLCGPTLGDRNTDHNNNPPLLSLRERKGSHMNRRVQDECNNNEGKHDNRGSECNNNEKKGKQKTVLSSSCIEYDEDTNSYNELYKINEVDNFCKVIEDWIEQLFSKNPKKWGKKLSKIFDSAEAGSNNNVRDNAVHDSCCGLVGFGKGKRMVNDDNKKQQKQKPKQRQQEKDQVVKKQARRRGGGETIRRCTHCQVTETPQWRNGPEGIVCNACGVHLKTKGELEAEYRPAASPCFDKESHSNYQKRINSMKSGMPNKGVVVSEPTQDNNRTKFESEDDRKKLLQSEDDRGLKNFSFITDKL